MSEKALVIGAGITGLFTTLYLAREGIDVTLIDRDNILSGTSGKFHGMLHSGARYSTNDQVSARECMAENRKLSEIASKYIINTGGYFVAVSEEEADFGNKLAKTNGECGIPTEEVDLEEFLKLREPGIGENAVRVFSVPDKVIHAYGLGMSVASEAVMNGAKISPNTNFKMLDSEEIIFPGHEWLNGKFDFLFNTAGPWIMDVAKSLKMEGVQISPALGLMSVYPGRWVNSVINRMRPPSDGDILVPYGENTILGTMAVLTDNMESVDIEEEDIEEMAEEGSLLLPVLKNLRPIRNYYSTRPLIVSENENAREITRDYLILQEEKKTLRSCAVVGGKFTTARAMGSKLASIGLGKDVDSIGKEKLDLNSSSELFLEKNGFKEFVSSIESRKGTIDEDLTANSTPAMVDYLIRKLNGKTNSK